MYGHSIDKLKLAGQKLGQALNFKHRFAFAPYTSLITEKLIKLNGKWAEQLNVNVNWVC